jgi:hypothetical protein
MSSHHQTRAMCRNHQTHVIRHNHQIHVMCHHIAKFMWCVITSIYACDVSSHHQNHTMRHNFTKLTRCAITSPNSCDMSSNHQIHAMCQNPPSLNVAFSSCNGAYTTQRFAFHDCTQRRNLEFTKESSYKHRTKLRS